MVLLEVHLSPAAFSHLFISFIRSPGHFCLCPQSFAFRLSYLMDSPTFHKLTFCDHDTSLFLTLTSTWHGSPGECLCHVRSYLSATELVIAFSLCPLRTCTVSVCSKATHLGSQVRKLGVPSVFLCVLPISPFHQCLLKTALGPAFTLTAGSTDMEAALVFQSCASSSLKRALDDSLSHSTCPTWHYCDLSCDSPASGPPSSLPQDPQAAPGRLVPQ